MNKSNSDDNKAAFDMLASHKDEIESALGTVLIWNRGNDIKSSKIYCHLENIGIEEEENWHLVAKFHTEWSKRFYDILMPYFEK